MKLFISIIIAMIWSTLAIYLVSLHNAASGLLGGALIGAATGVSSYTLFGREH